MSQSLISQKSIEFIKFANELRGITSADSLFEAKMRAAIGRLYYGVFNLLLDRFSNCTNSRLSPDLKQTLHQKDGVHGAVKKCISKTNSAMTTHIENLRYLRNFCDYDLGKNVMTQIVIEKDNGNPPLVYDDIEYAYVAALASAHTLIRTYTNHINCYDGRGHSGVIDIL